MDRFKRRFNNKQNNGEHDGQDPHHNPSPNPRPKRLSKIQMPGVVLSSAASSSSQTSSAVSTLPAASAKNQHKMRPLSDTSAVSTVSTGDQSLHPMRASGVDPRIQESMTLLRQALAKGTLSPEEEIRARESMAGLSQMIFESIPDPNRLNDALQNYQAIIRLLSTPSARRARYLDNLAYVEMSIYGVTKSLKTLDDSIAHSKQARDEALPTNDPLLPTIYHNLGFSVSHRALTTNSDEDMEDAIKAGREVLRLAPPSSDKYQISMVNLASRLQTRYKLHHRQQDLEEAMRLLDMQLQHFPPHSHQHGAALLVKSRIFFDRHDQSNDIKDIDEAISYGRLGLATVPPGHERQGEILLLLGTLYKRRYKHTGATTDLEDAVAFFRKRLKTIPTNFPTWPGAVAEFLDTCADYTLALSDPDLLLAIAQFSQTYLDQIPKNHSTRFACNRSLAAMLSQKYILSKDVSSLFDLLQHVLKSSYELNEQADITQQRIDTGTMNDFIQDVRKIAAAPLDKPVRSQALEHLHHFQSSQHQSKQFMVIATGRHTTIIKVFVSNLGSPQPLHHSQIEAGVTAIEQSHKQEAAESVERADRMNSITRDDHIDPFLGHRSLASNPNTSRVVVDMETLVREMLGWSVDEPDPTSWVEFEAREARLERESFNKELQEGRHPNPSLCRMCRINKPLVPLDGGGWTWNQKMWIPFGTHGQLMTRKHCSICRLILSLITTDEDQLHPRLAQIDREIQGTQFHFQRLLDGELMLGVEYGMISVGTLRMLNSRNITTAIRQDVKRLLPLLQETPELSNSQVQQLTSGDQKVDFQQLHGWIYQCHANHSELCNGIEKGSRYEAHIPLYLIDVQRNCIVAANSAQRYLTLSYVWGSVEMDKTLKVNLEPRMQPGGLEVVSLPTTIKDAIALVKAIGEKFLWTDALCIVQDDASQKTRDIPRMDIIYKQGFANIVALAGSDANAGLPGTSPNTRPPQSVETLYLDRGSQDMALDEWNSSKAKDAIHLVASPIPLAFAQEASKWNTRAWILQEEVLARRNIYFSPTHVYFKCNEHVQSEAILEGEPSSMWGGDQDQDQRHKVVDKFEILNPLTELRRTIDVPDDERLKQIFIAYAELVQAYTTRNLTKEDDILNAFSGMLSAFTEVLDSKTFCGLPIALLDLALLWTPAQTLTARSSSPSSSSPDQTSPSPSSSPPPPPPPSAPLPDEGRVTSVSETGFPTWSWAGWIGRVDYRLLNLDKSPSPDSLIHEFFIIQQSKVLRLLGYRRGNTDPSTKASPTDLSLHFTPEQIATSTTQTGTILHFIAPAIVMHRLTVNRTREPDYLSSKSHIHTQTTQAVVRIHDENGIHCGILFEHVDFHHLIPRVMDDGNMKTKTRTMLEALRNLGDKLIVGMSQEKDVYAESGRGGLHRVEGDIALFDTKVYPAQGPGSGLVNALVLSLGRGDTFERLAVGQIHVKAWEEEGPRRTWVKLA